MNQEVLAVRLVASGTTIDGALELSEEPSSGAEEPCVLRLSCAAGEFSAKGPDYFEALIRLRRDLEAGQVQILVNGASRDVWPSAMARSMGLGSRAYRMRLGHQARTSDLVPIFELSAASEPCSIAEQEQFREQWFASLGNAA
jgi:hypothetical protein